jgi:hypothetical protein
MPRCLADPLLTVEEMIARYAAGQPLYLIAHAAGVSEGRVRRLLCGAGVEIRRRGHKGGKAWTYTAQWRRK